MEFHHWHLLISSIDKTSVHPKRNVYGSWVFVVFMWVVTGTLYPYSSILILPQCQWSTPEEYELREYTNPPGTDKITTMNKGRPNRAHIWWDTLYMYPGPRLNKKTVFPSYGIPMYVKDKTLMRPSYL